MLFLGADHRGFSLKEELKKYLLKEKIPFTDLGSFTFQKNDDYPDIAAAVSLQASDNKNNRGILICGSGIGVCIVANKFKNVRAGLFWGPAVTKVATAHDDVNIACLPADYVSTEQAQEIIAVWLKTHPKKEAKYQRRLKKISQLEKSF